MIYYDTNYLMHHGIKGQRWGVRRYQNPDGTLTSAGKRRKKVLSEASNIAKNNADRLSNEATRLKENNKGLHERYDGADGWKKYAEDAYGTTNPKDYNLTAKDFKRWMSGELKSNLVYSDTHDKLAISEYEKAAKKWMNLANDLSSVEVASASKQAIRDAKFFIATQKYLYEEIPLKSLVDQMKD